MTKPDTDPIIEEIHQTRDAIAARFNNDLQAIVEDAQAAKRSGRKPVTLPPRPPEPMPPTKQVG